MTKTMTKKDIIALIEKTESELWEAYTLADNRQDYDYNAFITLKHQWNMIYALKEAINGDSISIENKLDFAKFVKDAYTNI